MLPSLASTLAHDRLARISQARQIAFSDDNTQAVGTALAVEPWVERSWRRCLAHGQRPHDRLGFDLLPREAAQRALEANQGLAQAARPVLQRLGRAIANTHYFAILTNAQGVVLDVDGPIDHNDRRARVITRIGLDLSERAVGTTAIGAALAELQPVWMHRGEHFYNDTSAYSCAGAPLFGPDGACIGMLDLTGIDTVERPELRHLVVQSARSIENALTMARAHRVLLRLNWSPAAIGQETDGLIGLDADGWVTGANAVARQMVSVLGGTPAATAVHSSELFALPWEQLFDESLQTTPAELPLWSGLRLSALAQSPSGAPTRPVGRASQTPPPLKDVEAAMIQKAIAAAHGNISVAAKQLGISRATVYRRLHEKRH